MSLHRPSASEYAEARAALVAEMGGKCVVEHDGVPCGSTTMLEFDHTFPRDWHPRKKNRMQRLRLYRRDWLRGTCQLACHACNQANGKPKPWRRHKRGVR